MSETIITDLANYRHKRIMGLAGMFGDHLLSRELATWVQWSQLNALHYSVLPKRSLRDVHVERVLSSVYIKAY